LTVNIGYIITVIIFWVLYIYHVKHQLSVGMVTVKKKA